MIGNIVGPYKITEKIGEGGMGAVFKGIDTMLEREVAIKMLRPELARQPEVLERFRTEAVTLAKLNHPNIATLYSFLRHEDDYFMVMEFVRGSTLETIIQSFGALAYERAIPLFCQALEGIDHAHKQGIVHRDIKPANVMVMESGAVKVMDFGIARVLGSARMTRQGNVVGTVEYMSPEQIRGEDSDARSDIYSLGILLYEMLTGRVPFNSTSEYEIMKLQIEEAPPPPTLYSAQLPLVVEQAIMRSLAKKASARYQSAGEFRAVLLGALSATSSLNAPTAHYAAPVTKFDREALPSGLFADAPKGTMVAGSLNQSPLPAPPSAAETHTAQPSQSGSTQTFASPTKPTNTGEQAPTLMQQTQAYYQTGKAPNAQPAGGNFTGDAASQTSPPIIVEPNPAAFQPPGQRQGSFFGKLNWKHYAVVGVLLIGLVSVPVAMRMRKASAPPPTVVETPPGAEATTPETPADPNATPAPVDGENANVLDPEATDKTTSNSNTADASKTARKNRNEKVEETSAAPADQTKPAETTQTPPQQETKPAENPPAKDEKAAANSEAEKKDGEKKEKKKGGGFGGFFKKIFGAGDKKKEEKKP
ncbi:MAG: protein kinase [Acidobacteria bacterium]|nr:protein kinase [Acidobacteriota bacterium]